MVANLPQPCPIPTWDTREAEVRLMDGMPVILTPPTIQCARRVNCSEARGALLRGCDDSGHCRSVRLSGGCALFPLVVGELLHIGAVIAHYKNLPIRLLIVGIESFVFESHPRTPR